MLTELHSAKKVVGLKQLRRALTEGLVQTAYVARDAEVRVTRPILELCQEMGVTVEEVPTMTELGRACGIEVGAAVAGLLK